MASENGGGVAPEEKETPHVYCDFSLRCWATGTITINNRRGTAVKYRYSGASSGGGGRVHKAHRGTIGPYEAIFFARMPGFRAYVTVGDGTIEIPEQPILNRYYVLSSTDTGARRGDEKNP